MSTNPASPETPVRKPIPDSQWTIGIGFHGATAKAGKQLVFADSFVAKNPAEFGRLLAEAVYELATQ